MHWLDRRTGEYNVPLVRERLPGADVVVIEWARRTQGLLLAPGNPLKVRSLPDLARRKARVVDRQKASGSHQLFVHLAERSRPCPRPAARHRSSRARRDRSRRHDSRRQGRRRYRDRGRGTRARACVHSAGDRALRSRRAPPRLFRAAAAGAACLRARQRMVASARPALGGYDVAATGRIVFNA